MLKALFIVEDPNLGWVLATVTEQYKEVQILCAFGPIENVEVFIGALIAWRERRRSSGIPEPFKKTFLGGG